MPSGLRFRFWLESVFGSCAGVLAVVTIFWRDWIEAVFGVDPDRENGTAEWLVVLILLVLAFAFAAAARVEWRRTRLART